VLFRDFSGGWGNGIEIRRSSRHAAVEMAWRLTMQTLRSLQVLLAVEAHEAEGSPKQQV
jgi:hypothetical protein